MPNNDQSIAGLEALARLIEIAQRDTGQSRRVADFLLAWHNAAENGGWDITDLWNVDQSIGDDMFTVLHLIRAEQRYPPMVRIRVRLSHLQQVTVVKQVALIHLLDWPQF